MTSSPNALLRRRSDRCKISSRKRFSTIALAGGLLVAGAAAAAADVTVSGSASADPKLDATPPAVTAPSVTPPGVTPPEVTAPEITKPTVTLPQITKAPSVSATPPSAEVADDALTVTVPFPALTAPEVAPGSVSGPAVSQPSVSGPEFSDPSIAGPQISQPSVDGGLEISDPSVTITPGASIQASAGSNL